MTRIEEFGWRDAVEPGIGRVVSAHGDYYHLVCNETGGEILARKKKSAFTRMKSAAPVNMKGRKISEVRATAPLQPITGDFVKFRYNEQGDSMILEVLPRSSHFERKDPTARRTSQTLAVNFDTLFIMMSLNENFSTARIDRYLTLAEDMDGGDPSKENTISLFYMGELFHLVPGNVETCTMGAEHTSRRVVQVT